MLYITNKFVHKHMVLDQFYHVKGSVVGMGSDKNYHKLCDEYFDAFSSTEKCHQQRMGHLML